MFCNDSDENSYFDFGDSDDSDDFGQSGRDPGEDFYALLPFTSPSKDDFDSAVRRANARLEREEGMASSENHGKLFTKLLHNIFLSKEHCDVTLETCTSSTKAHKIILVANSDYFSAIFSTTCLESRNGIVSFTDNPYITTVGLAAIIEYAYTGSFQVTEDSVCEILEAARYFLMDDVTKTCSQFITMKVKQDNCVWLSITAANYELDALRTHIENFLINQEVTTDNYLMVLESAIGISSDKVLQRVIPFLTSHLGDPPCSNELLDLMDTNALHSMIKSDKHGLFTDITLINFIVKWVERNEKDRLPVLHELFKSVNLLYFDEENLDNISKLPCIQEDERCRGYIREAQLDLVDLKKYSPQKDDRYLVSIQGKDVNFVAISDSSSVILKGYSKIPRETSYGMYMYGIPESLLAIDDKLFLIFGADNNGTCPFYNYEPSRNVWKRLASLPGRRVGMSLVNVGSKVYAIGGVEGCKLTEKVDGYDLIDNEWFTGIPLHQCFQTVRSVVCNDKIFVLVQDRPSDAVDFFPYDPNGMLTSARRRYSQPTNYHTRYNYKVALFVAEGRCIYRFFNTHRSINPPATSILRIDRYDPVLNHWSSSSTCEVQNVTDFALQTAIAHEGEIFLVARYVEKDQHGPCSHLPRNLISLFRYNEATNSIELLVDDVPIGNHTAIVHIPKKFMDRLKAIAEADT